MVVVDDMNRILNTAGAHREWLSWDYQNIDFRLRSYPFSYFFSCPPPLQHTTHTIGYHDLKGEDDSNNEDIPPPLGSDGGIIGKDDINICIGIFAKFSIFQEMLQ